MDLRTLDPLGLDWQTIERSVRKPNRLLMSSETGARHFARRAYCTRSDRAYSIGGCAGHAGQTGATVGAGRFQATRTGSVGGAQEVGRTDMSECSKGCCGEPARGLSVFITGGASGIGAATARRVLAAGGSVGAVSWISITRPCTRCLLTARRSACTERCDVLTRKC